jgi:hypothetical protein
MRRVVILFVVLILFTGIMLFTGCSSVPKVQGQYLVQPDPNYPYQGTWVRMANGRATDRILVVNRNEGTNYVVEQKLIFFQAYRETGKVIFDEASLSSGSIVSWRLNEDKNTLYSMEGAVVLSEYKRIQSLQ